MIRYVCHDCKSLDTDDFLDACGHARDDVTHSVRAVAITVHAL